MFVFLSEFVDINLQKYWNIFSTRRYLTHNSFEPHCPMSDFKLVKVRYFLLYPAESVECEFLSTREMLSWDQWLPACPEICGLLYLVFRVSSFTFRNIKIDKWTFHISRKDVEQEVIHRTESRTRKILLWSKLDVTPELTIFHSTILIIRSTRCSSWLRHCDIGWIFSLT